MSRAQAEVFSSVMRSAARTGFNPYDNAPALAKAYQKRLRDRLRRLDAKLAG